MLLSVTGGATSGPGGDRLHHGQPCKLALGLANQSLPNLFSGNTSNFGEPATVQPFRQCLREPWLRVVLSCKFFCTLLDCAPRGTGTTQTFRIFSDGLILSRIGVPQILGIPLDDPLRYYQTCEISCRCSWGIIIPSLPTSRGRQQTRSAARTKNLAARSAWGGAQGSPSSKPVASKQARERDRHRDRANQRSNTCNRPTTQTHLDNTYQMIRDYVLSSLAHIELLAFGILGV